MEIFNKYFELFKNIIKNKGRKKVLENASVVIILGIIIVIAGGAFFGSEKKVEVKNETNYEEQEVIKIWGSPDKTELEERVEEILSQIKGVGKVSVLITYSASKEVVLAYETKIRENLTEERDTGGGTRNINQSEIENKIIYEDYQGGGKTPVILKEVYPKISGVVVVAEGVENQVIRENVFKATQALLEVPVHRIQVFER